MALSAQPAPGPARRQGVPRVGLTVRLGATRTVTLPLIGTRRGCAEARDFTERTLSDWSLHRCREDAGTVVGELTANALLHARAEEEAAWLKLTLRPAHLVCAVTDPSDRPPIPLTSSDPLQEHGHGLHIVEALSEHWGWTRRFPAGKTVWAMLPLRPRD